MDPLSISATIVSLGAACMQTAKSLHDLRDRYKYAAVTIQAICSETMIIGMTLSKLQTIMVETPEILTSRLQPHTQVENIFEDVLTGCMVVYSVLDEEIKRFTADEESRGKIGFFTKTKYIWDETTMQNLLRDIRGQQNALTALTQLLQLDSLVELKRQISNHSATFHKALESTRILRSTRAVSKHLASIYDMEFDTQRRLVREDVSMISSTEFDFDDTIINSAVYRRTLKAAYNESSGSLSQQAEQTQEVVLNDSASSTGTVKLDDLALGPTQPAHTTAPSDVSTATLSGVHDAETQTDKLDLSFLQEAEEPPHQLHDKMSEPGALYELLSSPEIRDYFEKLDPAKHEMLFWFEREFTHLAMKYVKTKMYYFHQKQQADSLKEVCDNFKDVMTYDWLSISTIDMIPVDFTGDLNAVHSIWIRAPNAQQHFIRIMTQRTDSVRSMKQHIGTMTGLDLQTWRLIKGDVVFDDRDEVSMIDPTGKLTKALNLWPEFFLNSEIPSRPL